MGSRRLVNKYEFWEFLWPVIHDGACVGIVAQDMRTMQIRAFRADAVVMATGGNGLDLRQVDDVGHLHRRRGVTLLPGGREVRQPGDDPGPPHRHPRRGQVPADQRIGPRRRRTRLGPAHGRATRARPNASRSERYYFLEEKYPKYGNIVPRDIATREIFQVCQEGSASAGDMVYLDLRDEVKRIGRQAGPAQARGHPGKSTRSSSAQIRS
jgi:succinate dehydrogenase / fumarate reductase flavoprotein subunit